MELYLKYGFALAALIGGIVLYALGTGNEVAAGLISGAVGLVAGRAGTISRAVADTEREVAVATKVAEVRRKTTDEVNAARDRMEEETRP